MYLPRGQDDKVTLLEEDANPLVVEFSKSATDVKEPRTGEDVADLLVVVEMPGVRF